MTVRRFNLWQRIELFDRALGRCEGCGAQLEKGWHADHYVPFSANGTTTLDNGQALCAPCNLKKGSRMPIELREWQQAALQEALAKYKCGNQVFSAGVSVGGGKTIYGHAVTNELFAAGMIDRVIVVAPNTPIKDGWCDDSPKFALNIRNSDGNDVLSFDLPRGEHGYITTYQSVAASDVSASKHRSKCLRMKRDVNSPPCRTLVIFDELHHLGSDDQDDNEATLWARRCVEAFGDASYILCLTGTPRRSDGMRLPFIQYDGPINDNEYVAKLDYIYSYGRAVDDGIVRRVKFDKIEASGEVTGDVQGNVKTSDKRTPLRTFLERTALNITAEDASDGIKGVGADRIINAALDHLGIIRATHARAAALFVCDNISHANYVADCLRALGEDPVVVTSDDAAAKDKIDKFKKSTQRCVVAVMMVAEGVNIQRLRVCAFMSRRTAPLTLEQIMGRVVRVDWSSQLPEGARNLGEDESFDDDGLQLLPSEAMFVMLNKPELVRWADEVEQEIEAVIKERDKDRLPPPPPPPPPPLNLEVNSLEVKGDGFIIGGSHYSNPVAEVLSEFRRHNPSLRMSNMTAAQLVELALRKQRQEQAPSGPAPKPNEPYAVRVKRLSNECDDLVKQFVRPRHGGRAQYSELHKMANIAVGIRSSKSASEDELLSKKAWLERYVRSAVA